MNKETHGKADELLRKIKIEKDHLEQIILMLSEINIGNDANSIRVKTRKIYVSTEIVKVPLIMEKEKTETELKVLKKQYYEL